MPPFNDHALRIEGMKNFLHHINIWQDVHYSKGFYTFNNTLDKYRDNTSLSEARTLHNLFQSEQDFSEPTDIITILIDEIHRHVHNDTIRNRINEVIPSTINWTDILKKEVFTLEISLPTSNTSQLWDDFPTTHLQYCKEGNILVFNLQAYLADRAKNGKFLTNIAFSDGVVVFMSKDLLENRKIFYQTRQLPSNELEVTPYYLVPESTESPTYHFVFAINKTEYQLPSIKEQCKQLINTLFDLQPKATVRINNWYPMHTVQTEFTHGSREALIDRVDRFKVDDQSILYETLIKLFDSLETNSGHHHILIFTDQLDLDATPIEARLKRQLKQLTPQFCTRNKIFIFSTLTRQKGFAQSPTIMDCLLNTYRATSDDVLDSFKGDEHTISPYKEFLNAYATNLNTWATPRDLFTVQIKMGNTTTHYNIATERANQLVKLESIHCKPGTLLEISVTDSQERLILNTCKKVKLPPFNWSNFFKTATIAVAAAAAVSVVLGATLQ